MPRASFSDVIRQRLDGTARALASLEARIESIDALIGAIAGRLEAGGTLFTCGNGGSAAQALHLAEELIGRYRADRPPRRAVCLGADPTALTCIANDYGFEQVFARPCAALASRGDVVLVLSTSGNSPNVIAALDAARAAGALTAGLLGRDGGRCRERCDHAVIIPMDDSAHIQEAHQVVIHLICEAMEGESAR